MRDLARTVGPRQMPPCTRKPVRDSNRSQGPLRRGARRPRWCWLQSSRCSCLRLRRGRPRGRSPSRPSPSPGRAAATTPTGMARPPRRRGRRRLVRVRADQARVRRRRRSRSSCTATTSSPATTQLHELIRHTVRKGSIVIYPRWQTDVADPVPRPTRHRAVHRLGAERHRRRDRLPAGGSGPRAAAAGQDELLRVLVRRHRHREPREPVARRWDCPKPRAIFLDDPHDGGLAGPGRARSRRLDGRHPAERQARVPLGRRRRHRRGPGSEDSAATPSSRGSATSRNRNKDLVLTRTDHHGKPHAVVATRRCATGPTPDRASAAQRLRLELLLEGLGRAAQLRADQAGLQLRARRHPQAPLDGRVERRRAGRAAEDPERGADPAVGRRAQSSSVTLPFPAADR